MGPSGTGTNNRRPLPTLGDTASPPTIAATPAPAPAADSTPAPTDTSGFYIGPGAAPTTGESTISLDPGNLRTFATTPTLEQRVNILTEASRLSLEAGRIRDAANDPDMPPEQQQALQAQAADIEAQAQALRQIAPPAPAGLANSIGFSGDTASPIQPTANPTATPGGGGGGDTGGGGAIAGDSGSDNIPGVNTYTGPPTERQTDFRLRLRAITGQEARIYGANTPQNILAPLYVTNGLLFPYTPTIGYSQAVEYQSNAPVHSNSDFLSYIRTPPPEISITGKFSVQNDMEGKYAVAVLHFLRTVSKMHFGENDRSAGMPPPMLILSGYGTYMFNGLRVILKNHSWQFEENVDQVTVKTGSGTARVPALFTINLTVQVQHTPKAARKIFNLEEFRTGALMQRGGWI